MIKIKVLSPAILTYGVISGIVDLQRTGWEAEDTVIKRRFDPDYMFAFWKRILESEMGFMAVLHENERRIYGVMAGIMGQDTTSDQKFAVECMWRVTPEMKGYGHRLLGMFEAWAKRKGCGFILMKCIKNSRESEILRKYEHAGYAVSGTEFVKEV